METDKAQLLCRLAEIEDGIVSVYAMREKALLNSTNADYVGYSFEQSQSLLRMLCFQRKYILKKLGE